MSRPAERPGAPRDAYNGPFWDGLRERRLRMPRCVACGHIQYPMGPVCSACTGSAFAWVELSGRGQVWGFAVYHHAFHPAFAGELPYNVALVELDEGPTVPSNLVEIRNDAIRSGMRVEAVFEEVAPDLTLLRFRPAGEAEQP